jgi:hypothetical protein
MKMQAEIKEKNWEVYPERQFSELSFRKFTPISNNCSKIEKKFRYLHRKLKR